MTLDDLPQVLEIERSSYKFPWSEGVFRDCLQAGYCVDVAILPESLAGFVILLIAADEAHILNLCVAPAARKRGIAGNLLDAALARARQAQASEIFLEVRSSNTIAQRLYQQNGFSQIGQRVDYYKGADGREDALVFSLNLRDTQNRASVS